MKRPQDFILHLAAMTLLAGLCLSTPSCGKLKELLPKPAPKEALEKPLTEEEEKLQKSMDAQEVFSASTATEEPQQPDAPEINKSALVSILCYHDFADKPSRSDMVITYPTFRQQMQALKDAGIPVIPMSDVLAWK